MATPTKAEQVVAGLSAPFPEDQIKWVPKGGTSLAYITGRHAMNRLDEVVGPENWFDEYTPFGNDGVLCKLFVRFEEGGGFISKCGVGGYAEMKDSDDNEKSAESSAFKRAAVKFGIGRYLYKDGVPEFCGDCPVPGDNGPAPRRNAAPARSPSAPSRTAPQQPRYTGGGGGKFNNYDKLPPPGKAVFAWAKGVGDDYGVDLVKGMGLAGDKLGAGSNLTRWSGEVTEEVCLRTIRYIKGLENYDGKFDHIDTGEEAAQGGDDNPF